MNRAPLIVIITVAVLAAGAFFWWRHEQPVPTIATPSSSPATPPPPPIVAPTPAATKPAIRYPVPAAPPPRPALPSLDQADAYVEKALIDLLGRKSVQSFLRLDEFARNFVATVNNLATDNAAAQLWPVKQASGHFESESRNGATVISAKNAARYAAFIRFADSVDTRRAIALYLRLYPLFQRAYEELGYPGQYFNDRVVEVIDNLLATPNVAEPIKVKRITVDGSAPSAAAGLYVFEDPSLEASTAGQKILLRMGRENRAKLMAKLTSIRQAIVNSGLPSR